MLAVSSTSVPRSPTPNSIGRCARRTVRVSQSCRGFRGLLDAGRESVPHLRRRPTPSRGPQRQVQRADRRRVPGNARRATAPPRQGRQGVLGDRSVPSSTRALPAYPEEFPEPSGTSNVGGGEGHRDYFSRSLNAPRYACDVARIKSACVDTNFSTQSELRSLAVPSSSLNTPSNIFSYASSQMRGHSLFAQREHALARLFDSLRGRLDIRGEVLASQR